MMATLQKAYRNPLMPFTTDIQPYYGAKLKVAHRPKVSNYPVHLHLL